MDQENLITETARMPKVLLASMSGKYGGMEVRMQQDAEMLLEHNWRPLISTPHFPERPAWEDQLRKSGIESVSIPYPYVLERWSTRHLQLLKARLLTAPLLARNQFDLAHLFLCWTTYGLGLLWALAKADIPTLVSIHNAFPKTEFSPWQKHHIRAAFSTTQAVVAVSASALQHFMANFSAYLPADIDVHIIPNPVDTTRFQPRPEMRLSARKRLGLPFDVKVIGSIGRLDKQKRPWKLLDTLHRLHLRGLKVYLVLVGQGELESQLRDQAARLKITEHVIFAGHVADVEKLMPAFDIHLLLSRNEGFGMVTAESMAAGIPAVGSDVPGTRDILLNTDGGLLLTSDNCEEIAAELYTLLNDTLRLSRIAQSGPAIAHTRYDQTTIEKETLTLYRNALSRETPHPQGSKAC